MKHGKHITFGYLPICVPGHCRWIEQTLQWLSDEFWRRRHTPLTRLELMRFKKWWHDGIPGGPRALLGGHKVSVKDWKEEDVVKEVVADFAERRMTDREGASDNVALFSFARYPQQLCPFTLDVEAVKGFLGEVELVAHREEDGTGIGIALG